MENELIWLRSSVFSAKENWHRILEQIQIFIDLWKRQQRIKKFILEFNYLSGENIRFSILCRDDFKHLIAKKLNEQFTTFFLKKNFSVKKLALPINGVFLPHPANTIRYGLYNIVNVNPETEQINMMISLVIIQALCNEPIDEESILTFAFYLYAGTLKAFRNCNKVFNRTTHYANLFNTVRTDQIDVDIVKNKYESSKEMLSEIFDEIMSGIHIGPWLDSWILTCETEIKRRTNCLSPQDERGAQIAWLFINSIYIHLGLSENMKLMLDFFMNETLKETLNQ